MKKIVFILIIILLYGCGNNLESRITEQLELGKKSLMEQNYEEAIIAFQTVIELEPKHVEAYVGLVDTYVAMGDFEQAIFSLGELPDELDENESLLLKKKEIENNMELIKAAEEERAELDRMKKQHNVPAFEQRSDYQKFETIEPELQEWIVAVIGACTNEEIEKLKSLSGEGWLGEEERGYTIYSEHKDYRFQVSRDFYSWHIEIRTENDLGYYFSALRPENTDYEFKKFECSNWQCDGLMTGYRDVDGFRLYETATFEKGLVQGIHEQDIIYSIGNSPEKHVKREYTLYKDSKWVADVDENGNDIWGEGTVCLYPYSNGLNIGMSHQEWQEYFWLWIYW